MKKLLLIILIVFSFSFILFVQEGQGFTGTGVDGSVTISTSKNINLDILGSSRTTYPDGILTRVTANPTGTSISVANSSGFAANDEIILINLQGASGDNTDVGNYEFLEIQSIAGNTITTKTNIQKSYDGTTFSNQKVVVQRVPQWTTVTINSGGTLTANDWNGTLGGIIVFRATGAVNINTGGSINVNGRGFRFGSGVASGSNIRGSQGESYTGPGASANSANNGGGGGGGDLTNVGVDACGGGGAGGGYGTAGNSGDYGSSCGGSRPANSPGATYGVANLSTIFLGSGGGGGGKDENSDGNCPSNPASGDGADGSGLIIIYGDTVTVNGVLEANGNGGSTAPCLSDNGNGAGGSGGSIYIGANSATLGTNLVRAVGGNGAASGGVWNGAGGNGGSGRIRIEADSISGTTSPTASTGGSPTPPSENPSCSSSSPCCCYTEVGGAQRRCYSTGVCCAVGTANEYWSPGSCSNFLLIASGPGIFPVGRATPIVVSINNIGAYPDSYTINYTLESSNPNLIYLDTTGATAMSVDVGQVKGVFPKVTVFSTGATGKIIVNATSSGDPTLWRSANVTIIEGDLPLSLPEFGNVWIILIILLSGLVFYLKMVRKI